MLLPRLMLIVNPTEALLADRMDGEEYAYMCACAYMAQGKYASAKAMFEESMWNDSAARAEACAQPWPKTGTLYKNRDFGGNGTEPTVKFNSEADTSMLVKIYTLDGVLVRTVFVRGNEKAKTSLPGGTYSIKDGVGKNRYGEEEAFGAEPEGRYEIMTFNDGDREFTLERGYAYTITVNVEDSATKGDGIGSDWESWNDF